MISIPIQFQIGGGLGVESNITKVCLSPSQSNVAVVTESGLLWIGSFTRFLKYYFPDFFINYLNYILYQVSPKKKTILKHHVVRAGP